MSKGKRERKREKRAPSPMQSAGLLRFFEEETRGIRVKPEMVVILGIALIIASVVASMVF